MAIGPIYPTALKVMPYEPVGLERLATWAKSAAPYPVVAVGGISLERMPDMPGMLACGVDGVDGVAVVSAVTLASDPQQGALEGWAWRLAHPLCICGRRAETVLILPVW